MYQTLEIQSGQRQSVSPVRPGKAEQPSKITVQDNSVTCHTQGDIEEELLIQWKGGRQVRGRRLELTENGKGNTLEGHGFHSSSQPVGHNPFGGQMTLSQGVT